MIEPDGQPVTIAGGSGRAAGVRAGVEGAGGTGAALPAGHEHRDQLASARIATITDQLYGGDREMRIRQEILLGIGGYRALQTLGLQPTVYHMNEGHSAFLALERVADLMKKYAAHLRRSARAGLRQPGVHHAYASGSRARLLQRRADVSATSARRRARLGHVDGASSWPWDADPARSGDFCMTVLALRLAARSQWGQQAARRGQPQECGSRCGRACR